jgi:hypothetical protein
MEEGRGAYRVLVGEPEGKRPLGRPRRRWENNIKMDLQEVGGSCGDWMELYIRTEQSLLSSGILYSRLQRVTIPDAVIIQFVLLKMGMLMLETCRGL